MATYKVYRDIDTRGYGFAYAGSFCGCPVNNRMYSHSQCRLLHAKIEKNISYGGVSMIGQNHYQNVIQLIDVTKTFCEKDQIITPVKDISLTATNNEMILLIGPSGSGKTTLLTIIAGLIPQTFGEVRLFGREIGSYNHKERKQLRLKKIGFVFQAFNLIESLSAVENVALPLKFAGFSNEKSIKLAKQVMTELSIDHLATMYADKLSQGEKQRVAIARAFINNPDLIIADEPSACLESHQGIEIIKMLSTYAQSGKCVIVASHDTRLNQYADKIFALHDGQITLESLCPTYV
jgi:putative ABC transport system ATP-binding protein